MNNLVEFDEQLDDLQLDNLMIIQKQSGYKFSTDSVLLANFVKMKPNDVYVDLCSGSGVVAILSSYKNKVKHSFAVEIQKEIAEMAKRSIQYNNLNIEVINIDLKNCLEKFEFESVDIITVNPPYNVTGLMSENEQIKISTHELMTNISDISMVSKKLLKYGGKIFLVFRADRMVDVFFELRKNGLEPKRLRLVYPKINKEPNLILVEAKKGAKCGLKIEKPLILVNEDGTETEELKEIYNRK